MSKGKKPEATLTAITRREPEATLRAFDALVFAEPVPILVVDPEAGEIKGNGELVEVQCRSWSEFERLQRRVETGAYQAPHVGLSPNTQLLAFLAKNAGLLSSPLQTEAGQRLKAVVETGAPLGSKKKASSPIEIRRHSHINRCGFVVDSASNTLCGAESNWRVKWRSEDREICEKHREIGCADAAARGSGGFASLEKIERKSLFERLLTTRTCADCVDGAEAMLRADSPGMKTQEALFCMKDAMRHAEDKLKLGYRVVLLTKDSAANWTPESVQALAQEGGS